MFWSAALLRRFSSSHESREETRKFQRLVPLSLVCFVGTNFHELIRDIRVIRGSGCKEIQTVPARILVVFVAFCKKSKLSA